MSRKNKYPVTKEKLENLHYKKLFTINEIAEYLNCHRTTVLAKFKRLGMQKLPKFERLQKGQKFGNLTVLEFSHMDSQHRSVWKCICSCGAIVYLPNGLLKFRKSCRKCGLSNQKTHGKSKSKIYHVWQGMKTRCNNPNAINYSNYGGRGINYDPKWEKFENFYKDMGKEYNEKLTLERINNNKGYNKNNCIWADLKQQGRNKRTNNHITINKTTKTVTDWAEHFNINRCKIYAVQEAHPNWSDERIINKAIENNPLHN